MSQPVSTLSLRDVFAVLFKYKRMIVALVALTLVLVVGFAYWWPERFEARSKLLIRPGKEHVQTTMVESPLRQQLTTNVLRKEDIATEAEIIGSRALIQKALDDVGADVMAPPLTRGDTLWSNAKYYVKLVGNEVADALRSTLVMLGLTVETSRQQRLLLTLEKQLTVQPVRNSDVIEVRFKWPSPDLASRFLDRLVQRYLEQHVAVHREDNFYGFVRTQADDIRKRLADREREIATFKTSSGIVSLPEQRTLLLNQRAGLETALLSTTERIADTRSRLATLTSQLDRQRSTLEVGEADGRNPVIDQLRLRLATLELEEREVMRRYADDSVVVSEKRQAVDEARKRLEQELQAARKAAAGGSPGAMAKLRDEALRYEAELQGNLARERELTRQLREAATRLSGMDGREEELARLARERKTLEGHLHLYEAKQEELRLSDVMDQQRITSVAVIEPPSPPIQPVRTLSLLPNRIFYIVAGLLGSLVAGAALAFIRDYLDRTLDTVRKVESAAGAPVLGSLPALASTQQGASRLSGIAERLPMDARLLLVCSPAMGEGVSTVASAMAEGLARERAKRVLLVDCNFRDRGAAGGRGLSDVAPQALREVVQPTEVHGLFRIARGQQEVNAPSLFEQPGFFDELRRLAADYDYVLLDAPAVLSHPDALVLARHGVDAVVVVDARRTRIEVLEETVKRLHAAGGRVAGAVMNFRQFYIPKSIYVRT